jgi:hypothetical protein
MRKEDARYRRAQIHNVAKISRQSRSLPWGIDGVIQRGLACLAAFNVHFQTRTFTLREKVAALGSVIETVRGVGYRCWSTLDHPIFGENTTGNGMTPTAS